jgi:2-methylcitrate dehydratase PrpD
MARAGFSGPRTVIEGRHGFLHGFSHSDVAPDLGALTGDLGDRWHMESIAFKPYACGTMAQPYIDCALALREAAIAPEQIRSITCKVGEATVHRLWEPLAEKRRPTTAYSAKFSVPFCVAVGYVDGAAGLEQFTRARISDPAVLAVASRVGYEIDPENEYPANYTGHLRVGLDNGSVREFEQPHLRGGRRSPLADDELSVKYRANVRFGGWDAEQTEAGATACRTAFDATDQSGLTCLRR